MQPACVVAGVTGARVVAVAEPATPAEPAELVPVAGVLAAGAGAAVLPQPQATRLVITATVNRAVREWWVMPVSGKAESAPWRQRRS